LKKVASKKEKKWRQKNRKNSGVKKTEKKVASKKEKKWRQKNLCCPFCL
jgi:hypothetical protein